MTRMIDQDGRKLTANNQYMNKIFPFKEEIDVTSESL